MVEFNPAQLHSVATNIAQQLDVKDGNDDEKITGSIWNQEIAPHGGGQVDENATFTVSEIVDKLKSMGADALKNLASALGIKLEKTEEKEPEKLGNKHPISRAINNALNDNDRKYGIASTAINYKGNRICDEYNNEAFHRVIDDNLSMVAYTDEFGQLGVFKVTDGSDSTRVYNALNEFLYAEVDGKRYDRDGKLLE